MNLYHIFLSDCSLLIPAWHRKKKKCIALLFCLTLCLSSSPSPPALPQNAIQERSGRMLQALSPYSSPRGSPSSSPTRRRSLSPASPISSSCPPSSVSTPSSPISRRKKKGGSSSRRAGAGADLRPTRQHGGQSGKLYS